jgi:hypothetical protein
VTSSSQGQAVAHQPHPALLIGTSRSVINPIAVAHIETVLAAICPDCVLDEPGKGLWKAGVELSGIDPLGYGCNNVGAATGSVASRTVLVLRLEPLQDPGPVQKVMNQRVDGDHAAADLGPEDHFLGSAEQEAGQGHGENRELLARNEYLAAENRILKAQLKGRLKLSDAERATLAEIGHRLGRRVLGEVANVVRPDTILAWYRKLVARKFDGSKARRRPGRPRIKPEVEQLIVRMAQENHDWGYILETSVTWA